MKNETPPRSPESIKCTVVPPGQSLLSPETNTSWPQEIIENPEVKIEGNRRKELIELTSSVCERIPEGKDICYAVEENGLAPETAANILEQFSDFLEREFSSERIVLYFPFELIPSQDWHPTSSELSLAISRFLNIYSKKWHALLSVQDVRANFVDGDLDDEESLTESWPRVVKAAHFIPQLVTKNIITVNSIIHMMETSEDTILNESIADTLPVLADLGLIEEKDFVRMRTSSSSLVRNMIFIIESGMNESGREFNTDATTIPDLATLDTTISSEIEKTSGQKKDLPEGRLKWEHQRDQELIIASHAAHIGKAIEEALISPQDMITALPAMQSYALCAVLGGIRDGLIHISKTHPEKAQLLVKSYEAIFVFASRSPSTEIIDELESTLSYLATAAIIPSSTLTLYGVRTPDFIKDVEPENTEFTSVIDDVVSKIESNEDLSQYLLPVTITYGSRVKGYARRTADTDIAVFAKPGTDRSVETRINELLGKPLIFWLEQKDGALEIDKHGVNKNSGKKNMTHVLFEGVWGGDQNTINTLHEKLLVPYLYNDNNTERKEHLEQIERDMIQYRLMHKGYARFHPTRGGIQTKHSKDIDSDSMFWDEGFRQLATKMYLKKVFIPKLENK